MSDFLGNLINSAHGATEAIQPRRGPIFGNSPVTFAERALEFEEIAMPGESPFNAAPAPELLPPRQPRNTNRAEQAQRRDSFIMPETEIGDATTPQRLKFALNFDRPFSQAPPGEGDFKFEATTPEFAEENPASFDRPFSQAPTGESDFKFEATTPEFAEENPASQVAAELPPSQFRPAEISPRKNNLTASSESKTARAPDQHAARPPKSFEPRRVKTNLASRSVAPPEREDSPANGNFAAHQLEAAEASPSTAIAAMRLEPVFPPTSLRSFTKSLASPQNIRAAAAPAPIIRVNIGRIEVRAVTPAAPSARPPRARSGPMLSLEDYLKQRGGQR